MDSYMFIFQGLFKDLFLYIVEIENKIESVHRKWLINALQLHRV